jgi:hypothetical protein
VAPDTPAAAVWVAESGFMGIERVLPFARSGEDVDEDAVGEREGLAWSCQGAVRGEAAGRISGRRGGAAVVAAVWAAPACSATTRATSPSAV